MTSNSPRATDLDLTAYIRDVPDFPKPGILFRDITPLLANPAAFKESIDRMAAAFDASEYDSIAAAEARGFLFAAPLACLTEKPLVPVRKPGKLPFSTHAEEYELEYGTDRLELHTDAVSSGDRVLLVDDLLATGGTVSACCRLIEQAGGTVAGCLFAIELGFLPGREKLAGYRVESLIRYDD